MSTRPYATNGGIRIRQRYNASVRNYRAKAHRLGPAKSIGFDVWVEARIKAMTRDRDLMIAEAEQRERSKRNERKRDHGSRRPRGS